MNRVTYHVTGITVYGRRFRIVTHNYVYANGINLYRGSVWIVNSDGKRRLIKRVYN